MIYYNQHRAFSRGKQCPVCKSLIKKRVRRKFWMRLIPWSKYYVCGACSCKYIYIAESISYTIAFPALENSSLKLNAKKL